MSALRSRWSGELGLARVLWIDMLLIGTLVNLLATFGALIVASQAGSGALAAFVHFAPLPLNIWLLVVVLRARARTPVALAVAIVWFVAMTIA